MNKRDFVVLNEQSCLFFYKNIECNIDIDTDLALKSSLFFTAGSKEYNYLKKLLKDEDKVNINNGERLIIFSRSLLDKYFKIYNGLSSYSEGIDNVCLGLSAGNKEGLTINNEVTMKCLGNIRLLICNEEIKRKVNDIIEFINNNNIDISNYKDMDFMVNESKKLIDQVINEEGKNE